MNNEDMVEHVLKKCSLARDCPPLHREDAGGVGQEGEVRDQSQRDVGEMNRIVERMERRN